MKFDNNKSGWSIVYTGYNFKISPKNIVFLSLKIYFVLANSADSDEMAACCGMISSGTWLFEKVPVNRDSQSAKG